MADNQDTAAKGPQNPAPAAKTEEAKAAEAKAAAAEKEAAAAKEAKASEKEPPEKEVEQPNTLRGAEPGNANSTEQSSDPNEVDSSAQPIPSIAVARFYDENMRLVREGENYVYTPKKDKPYPYKLIHPKDEKLDKKLRQQYEDFRKEKLGGIRERVYIGKQFARALRGAA